MERSKQTKAYCAKRAKKAKDAILAAYDTQELGTSLEDCVADFMHLCDKLNLSWADICDKARTHYLAEFFGGQHGDIVEVTPAMRRAELIDNIKKG